MFLFQLLFPRAQHAAKLNQQSCKPAAICNLQPATCDLRLTCSEQQVEFSSSNPVNSNRPPKNLACLSVCLPVLFVRMHVPNSHRRLFPPARPSFSSAVQSNQPANPLRRSDRDIQWNFSPDAVAPFNHPPSLRPRLACLSVCPSTYPPVSCASCLVSSTHSTHRTALGIDKLSAFANRHHPHPRFCLLHSKVNKKKTKKNKKSPNTRPEAEASYSRRPNLPRAWLLTSL